MQGFAGVVIRIPENIALDFPKVRNLKVKGFDPLTLMPQQQIS